jgi:hypothetical protein
VDLGVDRWINAWVVSAWSDERTQQSYLLLAVGDLQVFVKADDGFSHGGDGQEMDEACDCDYFKASVSGLVI